MLVCWHVPFKLLFSLYLWHRIRGLLTLRIHCLVSHRVSNCAAQLWTYTLRPFCSKAVWVYVPSHNCVWRWCRCLLRSPEKTKVVRGPQKQRLEQGWLQVWPEDAGANGLVQGRGESWGSRLTVSRLIRLLQSMAVYDVVENCANCGFSSAMKGLGRSGQGATEHIKVRVKNDGYGLGANAADEVWLLLPFFFLSFSLHARTNTNVLSITYSLAVQLWGKSRIYNNCVNVCNYPIFHY